MTVTAFAAAPVVRPRLNWPFLVVAVVLHAGAIIGVVMERSWSLLILLAVTHILFSWIGVGLCYHRLLTHRSFCVPMWFEKTLKTIGAMSLLGKPSAWVATHKQHHANPDRKADPHSPLDGFWHSHFGWMVRGGQKQFRARWQEGRYDRFLEVGQVELQIPFGALLYLMGGWPFVFYGTFVRIAFGWHVTFCVNSVCHVWGSRRYRTIDTSRNNLLIALFTGGEGFHNNHHADQRSALTARRWWDFDPTGWLILGLEKLGLATKVVRPDASRTQGSP